MLVSGWVPVEGAGGAGGAAYLFVLMLWTFALSATVLVVLGIEVPTGSLPGARALVTGWGRRWRRGRRYTQIMAIAARHGLSAPLRGFRPAEGDSDRLTRSLRDGLQDAGVTFVKLGQMSPRGPTCCRRRTCGSSPRSPTACQRSRGSPYVPWSRPS